MENMEPKVSTEEKKDTLCKKNDESLDQVHNSTRNEELLQMKVILLEKEKEEILNKNSKEIKTKLRLESLYHELQRQNQLIQDECIQKIEQATEQVKLIGEQFRSSLEETTELAQCTIQSVERNHTTDKAKWLKERERYVAELNVVQQQNACYEIQNKTLEERVTRYIKKLGYFETTISKSNEVFDKYQYELSHMRKQIRELEQENTIWKDKLIERQRVLNQKGLTENADLSFTNQQDAVTENSTTPQNSTEKVKDVEEETSDPVVNISQQEIITKDSSTSQEIVNENLSDLVQKQAEDSANLNQIVVTENNESCEISAVTEEKSSVSDSVNTDNSKTDLAAPKTVTKEESKQNANLVCVNVKEQLNLPAQGSSNDQVKVKTESAQSVKHTDTNKNKSKAHKSKKNKK